MNENWDESCRNELKKKLRAVLKEAITESDIKRVLGIMVKKKRVDEITQEFLEKHKVSDYKALPIEDQLHIKEYGRYLDKVFDEIEPTLMERELDECIDSVAEIATKHMIENKFTAVWAIESAIRKVHNLQHERCIELQGEFHDIASSTTNSELYLRVKTMPDVVLSRAKEALVKAKEKGEICRRLEEINKYSKEKFPGPVSYSFRIEPNGLPSRSAGSKKNEKMGIGGERRTRKRTVIICNKSLLKLREKCASKGCFYLLLEIMDKREMFPNVIKIV